MTALNHRTNHAREKPREATEKDFPRRNVSASRPRRAGWGERDTGCEAGSTPARKAAPVRVWEARARRVYLISAFTLRKCRRKMEGVQGRAQRARKNKRG